MLAPFLGNGKTQLHFNKNMGEKEMEPLLAYRETLHSENAVLIYYIWLRCREYVN
jgi:hypothetical protein